MYTSIYQNSYIILLISFIIVSLICYVFQLGYNTEIKNEKLIKKFSWKYPLAISLFIWVLCHFFIFPPADINIETSTEIVNKTASYNCLSDKVTKIASQKIIMNNWN